MLSLSFCSFCCSFVSLYQGSVFHFYTSKGVSRLDSFLLAFGDNEDNTMWAQQPNHADLTVRYMGSRLHEELCSMARINKCVCLCALKYVLVSKRPSSMLRIDKDFVITLQSFKENNCKCWNWLRVYVCAHAVSDTPVIWSEKIEKRPNSTLISSTYGWVSHISLIRFMGISLSPKIVRVWKNGCLEGPF